jgi:small subunit ribosomal protein S1
MFKLTRTLTPEAGRVFFAMPYGSKRLTEDGEPFDFDNLYQKVFVRAVQQCGMTEERADHIFGTTIGALDAVWEGIQRAEVVVVDFTTRSADVALEFGWAMALGKRMVVLTQNREDIPTDIKGRIRPLVYSMDGAGGVDLMEDLKQLLQTTREQVVTENRLVPILSDPITEVRQATVITVSTDHAVVDTEERGPRRFCVLSDRDVTYTKRVRDLTKVVKAGQRLSGAIVTDINGESRYSLLIDKSNPWPGIAADFPEGKTFHSHVVNFHTGVGAFIQVAGGINGLIRGVKDRSAELPAGAEVEVEVLKVDTENRQVDLRLCRVPPTTVPLPSVKPIPGGDYPAVGHRVNGQVVTVKPEGQGGYLLLRLEGKADWPLAMLHCTRMSEDLRHDLSNGHVERGEVISVEILEADPLHHRIKVEDIPEQDAPATAQLAA